MSEKGVGLPLLVCFRGLDRLHSCVAPCQLGSYPLTSLFKYFLFLSRLLSLSVMELQSIFCDFCLLKVSALVAVIGAVYMKVFLRDSIIDSSLSAPIITTAKLKNVKIDGQPKSNMKPLNTLPSFHELTTLLNSR